MALYASRFVEKYAPQTVVWVGGANDFYASQEPKDIVEYFRAGAAAIPNSTRIIYMGTKPELVSVPFYGGYLEYNQLMKAHAAGTPNVVYVNNWDDMQADGMYHWDGLHLSQEGYDLWNCKVNALLRPELSLADARRLAMNMSEVCPIANRAPATRASRLR
uniref:SGNH hydrolase-type esterase domain-containing protein n=1 Tax=Zooxanthella nutricula TaxID=1333877 RepID=A0A7S2IK78_9DINO